MKLFLLYILLSWLPIQQEKVMVCKGPDAYAYHNRKCQGLKQCTGSIVTVNLTEAKRMNRKPCGYCYDVDSPGGPQKAEQCKATTQKGTRCSRKAGPNGYCWQHG